MVVLDATSYDGMPDAMKGYKNYFAALNLMLLRRTYGRDKNTLEDLFMVAGLQIKNTASHEELGELL